MVLKTRQVFSVFLNLWVGGANISNVIGKIDKPQVDPRQCLTQISTWYCSDQVLHLIICESFDVVSHPVGQARCARGSETARVGLAYIVRTFHLEWAPAKSCPPTISASSGTPRLRTVSWMWFQSFTMSSLTWKYKSKRQNVKLDILRTNPWLILWQVLSRPLPQKIQTTSGIKGEHLLDLVQQNISRKHKKFRDITMLSRYSGSKTVFVWAVTFFSPVRLRNSGVTCFIFRNLSGYKN